MDFKSMIFCLMGTAVAVPLLDSSTGEYYGDSDTSTNGYEYYGDNDSSTDGYEYYGDNDSSTDDYEYYGENSTEGYEY